MIFNAKYIMFSYSLFYKIEFHLGLFDSKDHASDVYRKRPPHVMWDGRPFTRRSFSEGGGYFVCIIFFVALSVAVSNL